MNLRQAVEKAIAKSGLTRQEWAEKLRLSGATLHDLMKNGTASGRTLAKLQRGGVEIADKKLIESLDGKAA